MIFDDLILLLGAGIFSLLALVMNFYIGLEVVRLVQEVFSYSPGSMRRRSLAGNGYSEEGRLLQTEDSRDDQRIAPFKDRDTVERLISHFEADDFTEEE